jgi:DNA-binding Xre family transcriptional regulator
MTPIRVRLYELREKRGWTQQALSDAANVKQSTISELETGKRKRIDFAVLERLAMALDVEPGELLEREKKRRGR